MMNKRAAKRRFKNLLIILLMIAAFCSGFFGHTILDAYAQMKQAEGKTPYYTSIQIRQGDNLWDIARIYSQGSPYSIGEYVEQLKRMNRLYQEEIHSGQFLTVVYYK